MKHGIISRLQPEAPFKYQAWPTVTQDERGGLYAVASRRLCHVDPFGSIVLFVSEDGGETWSEGRVVIDTPYDDRDPGIVYLGGGRLMISFYYHTASLYVTNEDRLFIRWQERIAHEMLEPTLERMRDGTVGSSYVCFSDDYGEHWEHADRDGVVRDVKNTLISVPISAPHGATLIKKTMTRSDGITLTEGDLLFVGKESYSGLLGIPVLLGTEGGRVWSQIGGLDTGDLPKNRYWEAHAIQLESGRLLAAFRVREGSSLELAVWSTYSDDGGITWTPVKKLCDGSPPHLLQLADGRALLSYSYRDHTKEPSGIRALISDDGGEHWSEVIRVTPQPIVKPYDDLGYPATLQLADGSLFTAYYMHAEEDPYPSILYTKWQI